MRLSDVKVRLIRARGHYELLLINPDFSKPLGRAVTSLGIYPEDMVYHGLAARNACANLLKTLEDLE